MKYTELKYSVKLLKHALHLSTTYLGRLLNQSPDKIYQDIINEAKRSVGEYEDRFN